MTCRMPNLNLPNDLLRSDSSTKRRRRRRKSTSENYFPKRIRSVEVSPSTARRRRWSVSSDSHIGTYIYGPNGDYAVIFYGWVFDGDKSYQNASADFKKGKIQYFPPPTFQSSNKLIYFDSAEQTIAIKVLTNFMDLALIYYVN